MYCNDSIRGLNLSDYQIVEQKGRIFEGKLFHSLGLMVCKLALICAVAVL